MKRNPLQQRLWVLISALALIGELLLPIVHAQAGAVQAPTALEVSGAWVRAMPPGAPVAAGYLRLHNGGKTEVRVSSLRSPLAKMVEMHEMKTEGGQMKMRQLDGLSIPSGETVQFAPGGSHLMFMGVNRDVVVGDLIEVTLLLGDGARLDISLPVRETAPESEDGLRERHDH